MHVLITGASGTVGRFMTAGAFDEGHTVTALGRRPVSGLDVRHHPYELGDNDPDLPPADALIHCALSHVPGKFRGGEGDDRDGFVRLNVDGTRALFESAKRSGIGRIVFLSSRAVYGDARLGEILSESDKPSPDTLYGEVKLSGEHALEAVCGPGLTGTVLRATGVYGRAPGLVGHKWTELFADFLAGKPIPPRRATEVHGTDLAAAGLLALTREGAPIDVFNVSDLMLDRRDLLQLAAEQNDTDLLLPPYAEPPYPAEMATDRLRAHSWQAGGRDGLRAFVRSVL